MRNFFIIKVNSVDEYFSLPKEKREWKGLYKVPFALPSEIFDPSIKGWDAFYITIKKDYPIQYFFRYWLFSFDNPLVFMFYKTIKWPLRDIKYAILRFFAPCFPRWRSSCPRHVYTDGQELIVKSNFAILLDFYYEEVLNGFVDWEADEVHKSFRDKLIEYVNWIEIQSKAMEEDISEELSQANKNRILKDDGKLDYELTYSKYNKLEKEFDDKQTEILNWIINNRKQFWT